MAMRADAPAPASSPTARRTIMRVLALAGIAIAIALVLATVNSLTHDRIRHNQHAWLLQRLDALVPPAMHDNDLLDDAVRVTAPDLLGTGEEVSVYRARRAGQPVAVIVQTVAPNGYRGPIDLLVAIAADGSLLGVQVIQHHETPGLGDAFEHDRGAWLNKFRGKSLEHPPQQRWTVRKDGGEFDAFTGATITPRAIVRSVRYALEYYRANRRQLFDAPAMHAE
jgi:electron transport complex protein RnfG